MADVVQPPDAYTPPVVTPAGEWLLDSYDGLVEVFHYDDATGGFTVEMREDVGALLDANKRRQNNGTGGYTPSREMQLVARIPAIFVVRLKRERGIDVCDPNVWDDGTMDRILNDPDFKFLRCDK